MRRKTGVKQGWRVEACLLVRPLQRLWDQLRHCRGERLQLALHRRLRADQQRNLRCQFRGRAWSRTSPTRTPPTSPPPRLPWTISLECPPVSAAAAPRSTAITSTPGAESLRGSRQIFRALLVIYAPESAAGLAHRLRAGQPRPRLWLRWPHLLWHLQWHKHHVHPRSTGCYAGSPTS